MTRKLTAILLTLALAVTLAACGKASEGDTSVFEVNVYGKDVVCVALFEDGISCNWEDY